MAKTDKELTAEIVNNYVTSWNAKERTSPLQFSDLEEAIKLVYKTIRDLPETNQK